MFILILLIALGLCLGSFLNALAFRIGTNQSISQGRSKCPHCEKIITWYDLVPVLNFVWLRGKCRKCHQAISWQYPLVEVGTTLALAWLYAYFGLGNQFFIGAAATLFLIPIFLTDLQYKIIPDRIVVSGIVVIVAAQVWLGTGLINVVTAMMAGIGFFLWQYVLSRGRWIGVGDIGLGAFMGAVLGWPLIVVALALAYLAGAVVGITQMIFKKTPASTQIPLAPFLTTATFFSILYGEKITVIVQEFSR